MADIIDFNRSKVKKGNEIDETTNEGGFTEEDIPTMLMCNKCGNCLFMLMLMRDGDVAPMCQHCQSAFDFDDLTEYQFIRGLNVPEGEETIGEGLDNESPPDDED